VVVAHGGDDVRVQVPHLTASGEQRDDDHEDNEGEDQSVFDEALAGLM
jgi:hypothetical protein